MPKYIERDALEVALNHRLNFLMAENGEYDHYTSGFDEAVTRVENFPAADVAPVRHAKWEVIVGSDGKEKMVCTGCRKQQDLTGVFSYCPNCGATMELED